MPYVSSGIILPEELDRRRKLTAEQKLEIVEKHKAGMSQRRLALEYGVSRRLIKNIVDPAEREKQRLRNKEVWRKYRPSKEEWAACMREHRAYKQQLYLDGLIKREEDK